MFIKLGFDNELLVGLWWVVLLRLLNQRVTKMTISLTSDGQKLNGPPLCSILFRIYQMFIGLYGLMLTIEENVLGSILVVKSALLNIVLIDKMTIFF